MTGPQGNQAFRAAEQIAPALRFRFALGARRWQNCSQPRSMAAGKAAREDVWPVQVQSRVS